MNKFLKKCVWFLSLLIVLNILYLGLLFWLDPTFKKVYDIANLTNQKFELLAIGNSMASDGIDTQFLSDKGIDSYNLSVNGNHVSSSLLILDHYLQKNEKPKILLVGLSSAIGRSYLNPVPYKNPEIEFFYHPSIIDNIKNPPLLNFQWLAVDVAKIIASKDHRNAQTIRGQWKTKKVVEDNSVFQDKKINQKLYADPYLSKMVNQCQQKGIKVILVELPGSNSNQNSLPFQYTVELANHQKQTVYNLNNYELCHEILSSKDWLAPHHLNEFGAQKLTEFLYKNVIQKEMDSVSTKK